MSYLYEHIIIKDTDNSIGYDPDQEAIDLSDFEENYKSLAISVEEIRLAETTFILVKSYDDFVALVDGVSIFWPDVKYVESDSSFKLNILSANLL